MEENTRVTELLEAWRTGDVKAGEEVMQIVFQELHNIAAHHVKNERANGTLQPTALVNEAYIRLVGIRHPWNSRSHFFAIASKVMRRVLVDSARRRDAIKRWGEAKQVPLNESVELMVSALPPEQAWIDREELFLGLDEALRELAKLDPLQSQIVEFRFFGGLTIEEIAVMLQIGSATVKRDWAMARAWLERRIRSKLD